MDFDGMSKDELLQQVKRLAGGGLGGARAYNELNELAERDADEVKDGYQLRFIGKDYARLQASQKTETVLVPNVGHNQQAGNKDSQNIFITGDNLDALKHLENSYSGKVDVIYIDPPYNTGNDGFVYADNFKFSDDELKLKLGLTNTEVERIRNLEGKSSHSAWLTFMYPRLRIAKRLLADTGVIFISIDDNEQANLKVLCDEVFAESNFIAQFVWERAFSPKNDAKFVSNSHDYVIMFARNSNSFNIGRLPRTDEANARYSNPDNDSRGVWMSSDISVKTYTAENDYPITLPSGRVIEPPAGRCWSLSAKAFAERLSDNRIWFGPDGNGTPRIKRFLTDLQKDGMTPTSILFHREVGHSQEGAKEVTSLMEEGVFDGPKPLRLIKRLLTLASIPKNGVILDFFAGSATTGDAVMQLNADDGGNRKYILVQLDEAVAGGSEAEKQGYKTIDQISRKRLEKASEKIRQDKKDKGDELPSDFDGGFKHYTLATTSETTLDKLDEFDPAVLITEDMTSVFDGESLAVEGGARGDDTLLTTWLVDDGYGLNATIEELDFAGAKAYKAENRLYILDNSWAVASTAELLNALGKNQLHITSVVVYAYALNFETLRELKVNLKTNLDQPVEIIERF